MEDWWTSGTKANPSFATVRILLVDDEPDITTSVRAGLTMHGFHVDTYNEPEKVLSSFESKKYDLALIDVKMLRMSGYDLYQAIRRKDGDIRICFLSAFDIYYNEFSRIFPNSDVRCFIRKPIGIKALISHIKSELNLS